jgi:NAD+ kinase
MDSNIPIAGVNLGRLGFLSSIDKNAIAEAIKALVQGNYQLDKRTVLQLDANLPVFNGLTYALNDCTISKRDTSSMIVVHTYVNGEFLNSYWADGLIIATPTGSTGYSLSCGGPIIFPNSGNFVITPIAPHNLTMRPMVIPDDAILSFEIEGRGEYFLCTLDSRYEAITQNHRLAVKKANFTINIARLFEQNFLSTLREKLGWGIDSRN